MKGKSYKDLSYKELVAKRDELLKKLVELRMNKVLGHLENPQEIRLTKKDVARLNTQIHAIDLGIVKEPKKASK